MSDRTDYQKALSEALESRRNWLEKSVVSKLKQTLRSFQTVYTTLYSLLLKKGLIKEDPYKSEAKMGEISIPETAPFTDFTEEERIRQLSIRLSNYDNQLDFLVNFYHLSVEFFTLDRLKRVLDLVKYIDWVHISSNPSSPNTEAVLDLINRLKGGNDCESASAVTGITLQLFKLTKIILVELKVLADFQREAYKLELREILGEVPEGKTPAVSEIKKQYIAAKPGQPFYTELAEEMLKEDYSSEGPALREAVLKELKLPDDKPKAPKKEVLIKAILIEGIQALGSSSSIFNEIGVKFDENEILLENRKVNLWTKIKRLVDQMLNKEEDPTIYEIEYNDEANPEAPPIKEWVNFRDLREDIDKKAKNMAILSSKGSEKFESLGDDEVMGFLERAIKDMQDMYKTLKAMDEYFKTTVDREDRNKVKGIKPELSTIKNAFLKANEKYAEYSDLKEKGKQFKPADISFLLN
jgi:hypothetical protein